MLAWCVAGIILCTHVAAIAVAVVVGALDDDCFCSLDFVAFFVLFSVVPQFLSLSQHFSHPLMSLFSYLIPWWFPSLTLTLVPFKWLFFFSWISIFHLALWIFISFSIIVFVRVSVCKCLLPLTIVFRDSRKQESGSNWTTNSMKFSPFKWRSYKS